MAVKESKMGFVIAGVMLGIFIASMDQTIVATAMGTIVSDLGGLDMFAWVTTAYLVAQTAGMAIFGKLSDMYGRKRFFLFGIIVFLLGSVLCGTAESMTQLSMYRAIQGIGGGAMMPVAVAIIFDVVPVEQRGKMTGLFGTVYGMSSIFGPLLGAYVTEYMGWHWIFFINLPIGLAAFGLIWFGYHGFQEHVQQKVDWFGAITIVGAVVSFILANKITYRNIMLFASLILLAGIFLLRTLSTDTSRLWVTLFMIVTGFGSGFSFSVLSMAAVHNFGPKQYGAANGTLSFVRELGMTIGITIYGVIQSGIFSGKLENILAGSAATSAAFSNPRVMLSEQTRAHIPDPVLEKMTEALSSSIAQTFMWALVPAVLALVFVFWMSGERLPGSLPEAKEDRMTR